MVAGEWVRYNQEHEKKYTCYSTVCLTEILSVCLYIPSTYSLYTHVLVVSANTGMNYGRGCSPPVLTTNYFYGFRGGSLQTCLAP